MSHIEFQRCLEIGCGTGKNTEWLITKAEEILAVDLSEKMLAIAREKISSDRVNFIRADIIEPWSFGEKKFDLITFSLVLEHIENLDAVFEQASHSLIPGGYVYVGELHPFKQYSGTKARFDTNEGKHVVTCYTHNISDFIQSANRYGLEIASLHEYFDNDDRTTIPRILSFIFRQS